MQKIEGETRSVEQGNDECGQRVHFFDTLEFIDAAYLNQWKKLYKKSIVGAAPTPVASSKDSRGRDKPYPYN